MIINLIADEIKQINSLLAKEMQNEIKVLKHKLRQKTRLLYYLKNLKDLKLLKNPAI